jgi:predicted PurR-regulated permease PerM
MWEKISTLPRWLKLCFAFPLLALNGVLLALLINYLQPLVSYFIIANIIAFLLELLIELLVKNGSKRSVAIILVLLSAFVLTIVILLILVPILIEQLDDLIVNAPNWIDQANEFIKSQLPLFKKFNINIESFVQQITEKLTFVLKTLGNQTISIAVGTITSIFSVLFVFIITIFLLAGGEKFWQGIFSWIPKPWDEKVPQYLRQTFKDYFFSRLILAGISSIVRAIIFVPLGIPSAILFAFGIGIGNLIPFAAVVITLFGTVLLLFKSVKLAILFLVICTIIDQVTDNVIAPRLMGELIGLNPIWLIISLFIGAKLGGVLGLFLSVPLASVIKKIVDDLRGVNKVIKPAETEELI